MDIEIDGFEWDENKENINIRKHGIDFSTAALVFNDENAFEIYDEKHSADEERFMIIGLIYNIPLVITVSYTERNNIIRIISARPATKAEEEEYYGSKKKH